MIAETLLREEVQRLHALESGLVATFDVLEGQVGSRSVATSIVMLIEAADRHLLDLERLAYEEEWSIHRDDEHPMAKAWREEAERDVMGAPPGPETDALCLGLLRRAVGLRLPCYESARLYAVYASRASVAHWMRHAVADERASFERLGSASALGVQFPLQLGYGRSRALPLEGGNRATAFFPLGDLR